MLKLLQWYMFHPISKDRDPSSGIGMQQKLVLFFFFASIWHVSEVNFPKPL